MTIIISLLTVLFLILFYRCSFLINNAIEKILSLTRRKEKFLVVAVVRFMRTIISRNVCFPLHLCSFIFSGCNNVVWHIGCTIAWFWYYSFGHILVSSVYSMSFEIVPTMYGLPNKKFLECQKYVIVMALISCAVK
jgi:hypothetical protein